MKILILIPLLLGSLVLLGCDESTNVGSPTATDTGTQVNNDITTSTDTPIMSIEGYQISQSDQYVASHSIKINAPVLSESAQYQMSVNITIYQ